MTNVHGKESDPNYPYATPTPKRVRVTGAKASAFWYARRIGEVFDVEGRDHSNDFIVRLGDGKTRFIDPEDCIIIDPPENATTQAPDIFVNVVEFALRLDSGYTCRQRGNRSGKYITLADAEKLAAAPARLQAELDRALGTLESERQDLAVYRQLVGARDGQIEALRSELAAYKKAKSENDERFMIEREEARAQLDLIARYLIGNHGDRIKTDDMPNSEVLQAVVKAFDSADGELTEAWERVGKVEARVAELEAALAAEKEISRARQVMAQNYSERAERLAAALDRAAYALFQIKRMTPDYTREFSTTEHEAACAVLNDAALAAAPAPSAELSGYRNADGAMTFGLDDAAPAETSESETK